MACVSSAVGHRVQPWCWCRLLDMVAPNSWCRKLAFGRELYRNHPQDACAGHDAHEDADIRLERPELDAARHICIPDTDRDPRDALARPSARHALLYVRHGR